MKWTKILVAGLLIVGAAHLFMSLKSESTPQQVKPWPVPEKYQKMKNPVASNSSSIADGKSIYMQHCKSCHGKEGLGDGPKAAQLDTPSGDFTDAGFQKQSDGALFYKIKEGRDDMPSFSKKIPDDRDVWSVINFVRTLE